MREDNQAAASPLQRAAQTLVARYHGQPKLVSDQAGWSRIIALLADDTSDGVRLQITSGQVVSIDPPDRPVTPPVVDLIVRGAQATLQRILQLQQLPNEPYLFGELTVEGPEADFLRLDYILTSLHFAMPSEERR